MVTMNYIGFDSHDRPVYKDEAGNLWKDTDPRSHVPHRFFRRWTMRLTANRYPLSREVQAASQANHMVRSHSYA